MDGSVQMSVVNEIRPGAFYGVLVDVTIQSNDIPGHHAPILLLLTRKGAQLPV
jgi:hypothetical protein